MVKVINVLQREGKEGPFVLLELQGELELVQSQKTLNFYGTVRKCTIPCTVDLDTAKSFIGKEIPGSIIRVQCEPYDYVLPDSDEVIPMAYRWGYVPEDSVESRASSFSLISS